MITRYAGQLGLLAVAAMALALSGCGNSKKGNGYSYAPRFHVVTLSTHRLPVI